MDDLCRKLSDFDGFDDEDEVTLEVGLALKWVEDNMASRIPLGVPTAAAPKMPEEKEPFMLPR
jgi:hypothetical protein